VIYLNPNSTDPIDQGDLIDDCPVAEVVSDDPARPEAAKVQLDIRRVVILTQTCDLANDKALYAVVAAAHSAQLLIEAQVLKAADIKGPIRAGRTWGWYFLPADAALGLGEMIVDFRRLHTVRLDLLKGLCLSGKRRGRIMPLYREHLAKHFAYTFSRIGLPKPYETM